MKLKIRLAHVLGTITVLLLTFFTASPAYATITGDQTPLSAEEIAAAIAAGQVQTQESSDEAVATYNSGFFECYSGANRYEVSAMEAKAAFQSSSHAIIVGENGWADALTAAGPAGIWDCPILLVSRNSIPACITKTLQDLKVSSATIIGGPDTVSPSVEQQIASMGISVNRIGGQDRYEVQTNIYQSVLDSWSNDSVYISSGVRFPDALSASPISYKTHSPIFLSNGSGSLNSNQKQLLADAVKQGKVKRAVITGGTDSVSNATESFLKNLGINVLRLGGINRYEVSANIAKWAVSQGILSWDGTALAMGSLPYDALCGSALQGKRGSALLIVTSDSKSNQYAYNQLKANAGSVSSIRIFGGEYSIPTTIRMDIADIFGRKYTEIPGFKVYLDAGHGFNDANNGVYDPGATANGYQEASLTVELANKVAAILRNKYGIDVFLNTDGGWYKLRHAEAVQNGCDLIVSIHFNSGGGTGTESLIHSYHAQARSKGLQDTIHPYLIQGTGLRDRGRKPQQVAILSGRLPATLLEIAFIDNRSDMNIYQSRKDTVAAKIAEGIARYAKVI